MYIYKKDDPVPMKFHYVVIFILALKAFSSIGTVPEMIDVERQLRGTALDWAGKFSVASAVLLIVLGFGTALMLLKRKHHGPKALYTYWLAECVILVTTNYAASTVNQQYDATTTLVWVVFYAAVICISAVYYTKRQVLFEGNGASNVARPNGKRQLDLSWMAFAGYAIIGISHFYMAYAIYQGAKFWFFMAVLLLPGIGDVMGLWFLFHNELWAPMAVYAVGLLLFAGAMVGSTIGEKKS